MRINEKELIEQKILNLRQKNEYIKLRLALFIFIAVVLVVSLVRFYRRKILKQKAARQKEHQQQMQEIEFKKKELAKAALQLNERDQMLADIGSQLEFLKVTTDNDAVRRIKKSIEKDKNRNREEFDLHFHSVNAEYYSKLKTVGANLTPTDLKMCALIKMGFSIKEMAEIMGIGAQGIKTSRSRIRKKLGLSRDVNLIDFLINLELPV